jgi:Fe-coproporphyrin III synthase
MFHFQEKMDSLPREIGDIQAPLHVRIKPTNVCNHHCWYCAYKSEDMQLGENMDQRDVIPREKMLEIVDDLGAMGVRAVTFSGGGEPFAYPHLLPTLKALAAKNIAFASLSNGALVKGEEAEFFAHHGTWLRLSIDGWDGPSYAKLRGVKESEFSKVLHNIQAFKSYGGPCSLGVSMIIGKENAEHVYDLALKVKEMGADSIKMSPCIVSNDGAKSREYHSAFYECVRAQVDRAKSELEDPSFEVFDSYHELESKFKKNYTWCPYQQVLPIIGADLKVYSCQDKAYTELGSLGSIAETTFKKFWFSDKNTFFKINPSLHCDHHCVSNQKNLMLHEYLGANDEHLSFV